jgi:hypothetical protein
MFTEQVLLLNSPVMGLVGGAGAATEFSVKHSPSE